MTSTTQGDNELALPISKTILSILSIMSTQRRIHLAITIALMLLGGAVEVITISAVIPLLTSLAMTDVTTAGMPQLFASLSSFVFGAGEITIANGVLALVIAASVTVVVRLSLLWTSVRFVTGLGHDIDLAIFRNFLNQPYEAHVSYNSSEVVAALEKVQVVIFGVLHPLFQGIVSIIIALFIVGFLFLLDAIVATAAMGIMGTIYVLISIFSSQLLKRNSETLATTQTVRIRHIQELFGAIRDVIMSRAHGFFYEHFRHEDQMYRRAQGANAFIQGAPRFVVEGTTMALLALYALYASSQPGGMLTAIPLIGTMAVGAQRLLPLVQQMYYGWSAIQGSQEALKDVERFCETSKQAPVLPAKTHPALPLTQNVVLNKVGFRYSGEDKTVLSGVDLTITKGTKLGIVGKTGGGKSTLVDLFMGLLRPSEGSICVDGAPITQSNQYGWSSQIAHVPQSIYLTDNTIGANIAFGMPNIDKEKMHRAAKLAQIDDYIEGLPEGYDTEVGERGVRLSGGQRQRLGLARAFYRQAPVLVLDEATSALDSDTEEKVMRAIDELDDKITIVMITHRLTSLQSCDKIIEVDAGKVSISEMQPDRNVESSE